MIFQVLSIDADFENISIDSTSCKVHQSANGGKNQEIRLLVYPGVVETQDSCFSGWLRQSAWFFAQIWQ